MPQLLFKSPFPTPSLSHSLPPILSLQTHSSFSVRCSGVPGSLLPNIRHQCYILPPTYPNPAPLLEDFPYSQVIPTYKHLYDPNTIPKQAGRGQFLGTKIQNHMNISTSRMQRQIIPKKHLRFK